MAASRNKPFTDPVLQAVTACLADRAQRKQSLVVGFSGGLDSTVLLHATSRIARDADLDLSALHVHHGLSSGANAWADACMQVCRVLTIPLLIRRVEVPRDSGEGVEAAARRMRHKALDAHPANWILLAHHANDQAETILHNLMRGAGVRGAAAMPMSRGRVLRPLLGLMRAELLTYAQKQRLTWIEDESNSDRRYTRNFLRHEILPRLTSRFPNAGSHLAAAAARFGEADSLLQELAAEDLGCNPPEFPLPLDLFRGLSDVRARNLLRALLSWHQVQPPDESRLIEFVRQLQTAGRDRHPRLDVTRYVLWCKAGKLHFRTAD